MASSKVPGFNTSPWILSPTTLGALGTNGDGGDPRTPRWFVGDTPGPLSVSDYASHDSGMRQLTASRGSSHPSPFVPLRCSATGSPVPRFILQAVLGATPPSQPPSPSPTSIPDAEQRLQELNDEENALESEIDKVDKDLSAWEEVRKWFEVERGKREVHPKESNDKFNLLRWGGKGVKVGGIDTKTDGDVVLNPTFEASHPAVIVEGYRRHELVHKKNFNDMGSFEAAWGWATAGRDSFVTERHIKDEAEAHGTQKKFYEESLTKLLAEKAELERLLKDIRAKTASVPRRHNVVAGDWLSKLAQTYYKDMDLWPIIYDANRDLIGSDPNKLQIGQKLVIPDTSSMTPSQTADAQRRAKQMLHPPGLLHIEPPR